MNATVTARVPSEIKTQVDSRLKAMGSSATELINAAYDYVLKEGRIPRPSNDASKSEPGPQLKALPPEKAAEFKATWGKRTMLGNPEYNGSNFKELLAEARDERYARFA